MTTPVRTFDEAPRVLLVIDQPVLAQYVALALSHGISQTQVARTTEAALAALITWRPHLVIIDMDLARGAVLEQLGYTTLCPRRSKTRRWCSCCTANPGSTQHCEQGRRNAKANDENNDRECNT